jgi:hypothetical protein
MFLPHSKITLFTFIQITGKIFFCDLNFTTPNAFAYTLK